MTVGVPLPGTLAQPSKQSPGHVALRQAETESLISKLSESTDYQLWRPRYHLQPLQGWMNDPCGPGYDPKSKTYYIAFQWNPHGNDWGNMSWGYATSEDFVWWKVSLTTCLEPSEDYDDQGIFTGCTVPRGITSAEDGSATCFYTSVSKLPIHYSIPYHRGAETLSVAQSSNGGLSWVKSPQNPILPGPPDGLDVTGWRDPFVASWEGLSKLLQRPASTLYGCISGGLRGKTPTVFLYILDSSDLRRWTYLGTLLELKVNFSLSRWSGNVGVNWEVANFFTLANETFSRHFLLASAEGTSSEPAHLVEAHLGHVPKRIDRRQIWMSGRLRLGLSNHPELTYDFGGVLDHGLFYAGNSFFDPITESCIIHGWITEEDLPDGLRDLQGWSGLLSLPRSLSLGVLHHVCGTIGSSLQDITSVSSTPDAHGTFTVETMNIEPEQRQAQRRHAAVRKSIPAGYLNSPFDVEGQSVDSFISHSAFEIDCVLNVAVGCEEVGLELLHSKSGSSKSILHFFPRLECFVIDRCVGTKRIPGVNYQAEEVPHTLFKIRDVNTGQDSIEPLRMRIFFDVSVLEVFVNGRTVISTRLYSSGGRVAGLRFFARDGVLRSSLASCEIWDGLAVDSIQIK